MRRQKKGKLKKGLLKGDGKLVLCIIRARFRSSDLWVMGPPRFRCATLMLVNKSLNPYYLHKI